MLFASTPLGGGLAPRSCHWFPRISSHQVYSLSAQRRLNRDATRHWGQHKPALHRRLATHRRQSGPRGGLSSRAPPQCLTRKSRTRPGNFVTVRREANRGIRQAHARPLFCRFARGNRFDRSGGSPIAPRTPVRRAAVRSFPRAPYGVRHRRWSGGHARWYFDRLGKRITRPYQRKKANRAAQ